MFLIKFIGSISFICFYIVVQYHCMCIVFCYYGNQLEKVSKFACICLCFSTFWKGQCLCHIPILIMDERAWVHECLCPCMRASMCVLLFCPGADSCWKGTDEKYVSGNWADWACILISMSAVLIYRLFSDLPPPTATPLSVRHTDLKSWLKGEKERQHPALSSTERYRKIT